MTLNSEMMKPSYVSCIRINGKPILPPLMSDERRQEMRRLRDEAVVIEDQLKEKRRSQLMEEVRSLLSICLNPDKLNISQSETSNSELTIGPLQLTPVRNGRTTLEQPSNDPLRTHSLPTTPLFDEQSLSQMHKNFLAMKEECKEISYSETSVISTDLGRYMNGHDSESSGSLTPRAMSETDVSENLECSTPIKTERFRRLSYTLEAPSPVLLRLLQTKAATCEKESPVPVPPLDLSVLDTSKDNLVHVANHKSSSQRVSDKEHLTEHFLDQGTSDKENSPVQNRTIENNLRNKLNHNSDILNGNSLREEFENNKLSEKSLFLTDDSLNGNSGQQESNKKVNLLEEFLVQQQKLMNELLEKQAKEQERLVNLFKVQEQQLFMQLQEKSASQATSTLAPTRSPVRRSLENSFNRSAKAKTLFDNCHLAAVVRGYLTRRLLATDRIQAIIQTIRDTTTCIKELNQGNLTILPSDVELHRRLIQQLNGAIHSLHEIFFEWDVSERMSIIARDREKKADQLIITGRPVRMRPRSRSLSSATIKSLERKLSRQESKTESNSDSDRADIRQESRNSSRPSSASTVLPRTSPSSASSSICLNRRSPSSVSSSSNCPVQQNGSFYSKNKLQPLIKSSKKPWR